MNNQTKKIVAWIVGVVVLIVVVIGGIFGIKHYMTEKTYEKPINSVISSLHRIGDKEVTKDNSKIIVYDNPDEENSYLITITFYSRKENSTLSGQFAVDKTTNHVENPDVKIPVSNLKKLYESDHLKE